MINVQPSSLKITNPEHRKERIKNDLKYSWAMGSAAGLGTAAAIIGFQQPDVYVNGAKKAAQFVKTQAANAQNSNVGQKAIKTANNVAQFIKGKATKIAGTNAFNKVYTKISPALNSMSTKWTGLKTEVGKMGKTVSGFLSKIPTKYKIAGSIALATLALVTKLSNDHAYNQGKIDGRYENQ